MFDRFPLLIALAVLGAPAACKLFADDGPCVADHNCPADEICRGAVCEPRTAPRDAGSRDDAGPEVDAGPDIDAGPRADAGPQADGGGFDAGPPDAGPPDAGPDPDLPFSLYRFGEIEGTQVADTSGNTPALDLTIDDAANVTQAGGALTFTASSIARTPAPATSLIETCQASAALTVEAWIQPENLSQLGPARIVTLSTGTTVRNFTLGQDADTYIFRLRDQAAADGGRAFTSLSSQPAAVALSLQHVVVTYDTTAGYTFFIDGAANATAPPGGDFGSWYDDMIFGLANEIGLDRAWLGRMEQVAVWCRALPAATVADRFAAGPS